MNTILPIHVVSPKKKKLARILLIVGICLTITVATVVVLEETTHLVPVEAGAFDCVAGLLATGFTFISMAMAPPAGVAAIFGWGAGAVSTGLSVSACQTGALKNMIAAAYARHGLGYAAVFKGYVCSITFKCWATYKAATGGSSGSW